jgi:PhnB protein
VDDAAKAIDFYKQAFGAGGSRLPMGDRIGHAELQSATPGSCSTTNPRARQPWPKARGGSSTGPSSISMMWMAFRKAMTRHPDDGRRGSFWGDRMGSLTDPFGHSWSLATHVEDVRVEPVADAVLFRQKQAES